MRIDPKGTVGGYPALRVRRLVRTLSTRLYWDLKTVATVLSVTPGEAKSLVEATPGTMLMTGALLHAARPAR